MNQHDTDRTVHDVARRGRVWPRTTALVLIWCAAACSGPAAAPAPIAPCSDEAQPAGPGVATSGVEDNGIQINGIQINGIQINGIQINGIQINGALPDAAAEADLIKLYTYLVECALPAGESATITRADGVAVTVEGSLGLAPEWRDGPLSCTGERRVSACLAARSNALGKPVSISLRGAGLTTTAVERDLYSTHEGAFWADLFADEPYIKVCLADGGGISGRVCAEPAQCGFLHLGDCREVCGARDPIDGHYSDCDGEREVVNTFLNLGARVVFGQNNICVTGDGGALYCWGQNTSGQVGDGTTQNRADPTPVIGLDADVVEISVRTHACARKRDGGLWCWGNNDWGQLGDGTTAERHTPQHVAALGLDVIGFGIGAVDSCAVRSDGSAWCWGKSSDGAGNEFAQTIPVAIGGLERDVARISSSTTARHFCAIMTSGAVSCFGRNDDGQLGDGTTTSSLDVAVAVASDNQGRPFGDVTDVCASDSHTCARKSDGSAWCWGDGLRRPRDMRVGAAIAPGGLTCGLDHACFVAVDSSVWCVGDNAFGQLGFDTGGAYTAVAEPVPGLDAVSWVNAGTGHTCAMRADGGLWCWGSNQFLDLSIVPKEIVFTLP